MKKSAKAKPSAKAKKKPVPARPKAAKARPAKKRGGSLGAAYYAESKRLGFRLIEAGDEALYRSLFTDAKTMEHISAPLSAERAKANFERVLVKSAQTPWVQRISVVVAKAGKKPIGISSIKIVDADKRIAEVGMLLKATTAAKGFSAEASQALITSAFRRHTIEGITALAPTGHKLVERLITKLGYDRGQDLAATPDRGARSTWSMSREKWASTYK